MLKLFGSIDGRFKKIGFPLIEISGAFPFTSLNLEDFIKKTGIYVDPTERSWISSASSRLDLPLLVAYAAKKAGVAFSTKEQFLDDMRNALNRIDGERDIFLGIQTVKAFRDNTNLQKSNYVCRFPLSLQDDGSYPRIFYPRQFFRESGNILETPVNFVYIDLLRVNNIDIKEGTWSSDFHMDIVSSHENPLDIINFNNLSSVNPKFEVKRIWKERVDEEEEASSRFYIMANFEFSPMADNYPFDWQHIYISYSISDGNRYGIIRPIPESLLIENS